MGAGKTGSTGVKVVGGTLVIAGVDGDNGAGDTMEDVLAATAVRRTGGSVIRFAFGAVMAGVGIVVEITRGATVAAIVEAIVGNETVGMEAPVVAVMRGIQVAVTGRAAIAGVGGS